MTDTAARRAELYDRLDPNALATAERLQGEFGLRFVDEFEQLDQEFTDHWSRYIYGYLYNRGVLDDRTRVLVIIGECCVLDESVQLPNHIRTALSVGATPREILEVILQSSVYAGNPRMCKAMRVFRKLMIDLDLTHELQRSLEESPFRSDALDPRPSDKVGSNDATRSG
jgi:4-carboxymuconolactone decarboxylase